MATSTSLPAVLHADQEHDALRTVIILILIVFLFVGYSTVNRLLNLPMFSAVRDYAIALSCVLGLALALSVSSFVEKGLKRVWHSGRTITLNEEGVRAQFRYQEDRHIHQNGHITQLNWTFKLKGFRRGGREKRLSAKWICLACQLQQDDQRLIVYSYMPPQKAAAWLENDTPPHKFQPISLADISGSSLSARVQMPTRPEISNEMLTGKDGRYWLAERNRWLDGLELTPEDFAALMHYLKDPKGFENP